jgi:hypothetical protein
MNRMLFLFRRWLWLFFRAWFFQWSPLRAMSLPLSFLLVALLPDHSDMGRYAGAITDMPVDPICNVHLIY